MDRLHYYIISANIVLILMFDLKDLFVYKVVYNIDILYWLATWSKALQDLNIFMLKQSLSKCAKRYIFRHVQQTFLNGLKPHIRMLMWTGNHTDLILQPLIWRPESLWLCGRQNWTEWASISQIHAHKRSLLPNGWCEPLTKPALIYLKRIRKIDLM